MNHRTSVLLLVASVLLMIAGKTNGQPAPATQPIDRAPMIYYPIDQRPEFSMSLNGTWKFKLGPVDTAFAKPDFDDSAWKPITVPGNWELQGFEEPTYGVKIPDTEGFYRRTFLVPDAWKGCRVFIRFESVSFGMEFWVDGKRVGSFDSAFNRSEFDVTDFVKFGQPTSLSVRATRRNKGWEFDAHDDWSLSGIQRDVLLFSLPDVHVKDSTVTTLLHDDGKTATISFRGMIENSAQTPAEATLNVKVLDAQGSTAGSLTRTVKLAGATTESVAGDIPIENPQLWNAETPTLYMLDMSLSVGEQQVHLTTQRIGLREITVTDGVFKINGKPVKLHGVNHHDLHPETGRCMTREQYVQDMELMKAANVNAIRMCHYPPQQVFLDLCDEYGIYVLDEVPFGQFGEGSKHLSDPSFQDNLAVRAKATVARDKNRACVVLWTVGNEMAYTPMVVATAGLVKELDPSRPRCLPHPSKMGYFPLPPELNVVDEHYLQTAAMGINPKSKAPLLEDIFKRTDITAPVMMSEFAHAQSAALEDLRACWDMIESSDRFMGGCVWMFQDQGLYRKVPAGSYPGMPKVIDGPAVVVGKVKAQTWVASDRVIDTSAQGGKDGIVEADRFPKSSYWGVRRIFSPVQIPIETLRVKAGRQNVQIPILNRYDFTDLSSVSVAWELHVDGRKASTGPLALAAPPRTATTCEIAVDLSDQPTSHDLFLNLSFTGKDHRPIVERTLRLLPSNGLSNPYSGAVDVGNSEKITETDQGNSILFSAGKTRLQVNRDTGNVQLSIEGQPTPVFDGLALRVGRSPQMAEIRAYGNAPGSFWEPYLLTKPIVKSVSAQSVKDGHAQIDLTLQFDREGPVRPAKKPTGKQAIVADIHLSLSERGFVDVGYTLTPVNTSDSLLELGLVFKLPPSSTKLTWLGKGPYAVYPAQAEGMERGVFTIEPKLGFDPVNRMYWGDRTQVNIAAATDAAGTGLGVVCPDATISVEPDKDAAYFTHVLLAAGHGQKRKVSLVTIKGNELKPISGAIRLIPLSSGQWPTIFQNVLAHPQSAPTTQRTETESK